VVSAVEKQNDPIPDLAILRQNYPNPFNPSTAISYQLSANSRVILGVYDVLGRHVQTLVLQNQNAGAHRLEWNAGSLPSGVYFYRLQVAPLDGRKEFTDTKAMVLVK
jgi:hypothetical protein